MIKIAEIHSNTNGKSHRVRSVLWFIMSFLSPSILKCSFPCVSLLNEKMLTKFGVVTHKENVRMKLLNKGSNQYNFKWTLYKIYSVIHLWELTMFLFSYYNPTIVTWLSLLFHIYCLGRTTQNKCDTVNHECTVRNSETNISLILICSYIWTVIIGKTLTLKLL
jgi:hypothetical protein